MTFDLNNRPFLDLDGNPVADSHMGKVLAQALLGTSQGPVVKHYDWALALHSGKPIELDNADADYLRKFIEGSQFLNILPKRQLTQALDDAKAAKAG